MALKGKGIFVDVVGVLQQSDYKVAATDVVSEVAEQLAAKGVVPHVLNDRPAPRERMSVLQLFRGRVGKAFQYQRFEGDVPSRVDQSLMRKYRVAVTCRPRDNQQA